MKACGQHFSPELLRAIESEAAKGISRRELSRRICGWLDWRNALGEFKAMSCRKALKELQRRGALKLPESPYEFANSRGREPREEPEIKEAVCAGSLKELGEIEIIPVFGGRRYSRIWNRLMESHHYLGRGPLCGAQMRYLIGSRHGWVGGLSFSASSWHVADRDHRIGWSAQARAENRDYVINNSRFLILPTVEVANLGSYVLSRCLERLGRDWQGRYGYEPVLVESFVPEGHFSGGVYRAANWREVGRTTSGHHQGRYRNVEGPTKKIFLYPLKKDYKKRLCQKSSPEPQPEPVEKSPAKEPVDWVEEEFGGVSLPDKRLQRRLLSLTRDFYACPQSNIPEACDSKEKIKAAYRFMENPQVSMPVLLENHARATAQRMQAESVVLSVQDTTFLNYSTHPMTQGIGPIGGPSENVLGLVLHDTVAFNLQGTPLGVLDAQCWARSQENSSEQEKESGKWQKSLEAVLEAQKRSPETTVVNVSDRESDIYELFEWQRQSPQERPHLLIRAQHNRGLKPQNHLWDYMWRLPRAGIQPVDVPRQGRQKARTAELEIRYDQVTLQPPSGKRSKKPVQVWAVHAQEANPPKEAEPLEWLLLTTLPVSSFQEAAQKVEWYTLRFQIEVYHRTLKSGCRIEDRQLEFADRLERALAIDMVVAWRIFYMTKLGRETPDLPCTVFLEEDQWKALTCYTYQTPEPPQQPPTLQQAIRMIASLGGFIGRKSDGQPGTQTLWRGIQRLIDITTGWQIAHQRRLSQTNEPVPNNTNYG